MERMWIITLISILITALVVGPAVYFLAPREVEVEEAPPEPVKIGAIFPLTGVCSYMGVREAAAAKMALDEINAMGGVLGGRPLVLIIEDDETTPSSAVDAAHKLIDVEKVPIIIGSHNSACTIPSGTYSNEQGIPQIGVSATAPDTRYVGPYFWSVVAEDKLGVKAMVKFALDELGSLGNVGTYTIADPYGRGIKTATTEMVEKLGGEVVVTVEYEAGKGDYRMELDRLFAEPLDAVFGIAWGPDAVVTLRQLKELGYFETYIGRTYWWVPSDIYIYMQEDYPDLIEGLKGIDYGGYYTPKGIEFQEKFRRLYPDLKTVDFSTFNAYDALWIAALAINLANSDDPARINEVLPEAFSKYYGTATPDMRVDEDGMQIASTYLKRVFREGEIVTLGSFMFSFED